jgi:uncharacterized protein YndB with AHSA1/START domain
MASINHKVGIAGSIKEIYSALTTDQGLSRWWTSTTSGAGDVGSIISFRFDTVVVEFEVIELKENTVVGWRHHGEMPDEWSGTIVSFELRQQHNQVIVMFEHGNWQGSADFMAHCSMKWAVFMLSLKLAIETGNGRPYPDDIQIDLD